MKKRGSGVLLHITSLPSKCGIGDLGPEAYRFVDFLAASQQKYWQILPVNPTDVVFGSSPYSSISAFALNTLLISPERLVDEGWLKPEDVESILPCPQGRVDYPLVTTQKKILWEKAFRHFQKSKKDYGKYERFCRENAFWLENYALFVAIKEHFQGSLWTGWPAEIRQRKPEVIKCLATQFADQVNKAKFLQYVFFSQWLDLKSYCRQKGVSMIGDIPIYVNDDSVDVWMTPDIFKLKANGTPSYVAGVPPDYFSTTGQRWGNPVYRWQRLKETGFSWWIERVRHNLKFFDSIRIDHFRGLIAYWQIPAREKTAILGEWVKVPSEDFFAALFEQFPKLPVIAEDLGIITPEVTAMMHRYDIPGMKVLLFAFSGNLAEHPYIPENYQTENCVVYTGTHDNNTARGWFENDMTDEEKKNLFAYFGREISREEISWELISAAMRSKASVVVIPLQDVLGLGQEARMNKPATTQGNWQWRLPPGALGLSTIEKLRALTQQTLRA